MHDEVSHLFDLQCYIPFFHNHLKLVLFLVKIINLPAIQRFVFFAILINHAYVTYDSVTFL
jgi:hypothetical protein